MPTSTRERAACARPADSCPGHKPCVLPPVHPLSWSVLPACCRQTCPEQSSVPRSARDCPSTLYPAQHFEPPVPAAARFSGAVPLTAAGATLRLVPAARRPAIVGPSTDSPARADQARARSRERRNERHGHSWSAQCSAPSVSSQQHPDAGHDCPASCSSWSPAAQLGQTPCTYPRGRRSSRCSSTFTSALALSARSCSSASAA